MLVTINNSRVVELALHIPRVGAWHGDVVVDRQDTVGLDKAITLNFEDAGVQFQGTTVRSGVFADFVRMRFVAGSAKLYRSTVTPKSYQGVPLKIPLTDVLQGATEKLSPTSDNGTLGTVLQKWVSIKQGAIGAIMSMLDPFNVAWRMLTDGTFWCGSETWASADNAFDYVFVDQNNDVGRLTIASEGPSLQPGTTLRGRKIGYVQHLLDANGFRTIGVFEE